MTLMRQIEVRLLHRRRGIAAALLALPLTAVAACQPGGTQLSPTDIAIAYERQEVSYAGSTGEFRVQLLGAEADGRFGERMLDAVAAGYFGPPTRFTYDPASEVQGNYRIVLAFGDQGSVAPRALCVRAMDAAENADGASGGMRAAGPDVGELYAAFCRGTTYLTAVRGYLPEGTQAGDPLVDDTVASAVNQLFPYRNPTRMNGPDLVSKL